MGHWDRAAHAHHHSGALTSFTKTQWLSLEARLVSTACREKKNVHEQKQGRSWQTHKMMAGMRFYKHCFCRIFSSQNMPSPWGLLWLPWPQWTPSEFGYLILPSFHALLRWPGGRLETLVSATQVTDHRYSQILPSPRMHVNPFPKQHVRIALSLNKTTELGN